MASITQEQATQRMAELVDYLAVTPIDSPEAAQARTMLSLWEHMTGIHMAAPVDLSPQPPLLQKGGAGPVVPPTAAEIAEARQQAPAFGRFEALPPAVKDGHYGQMRPAPAPYAIFVGPETERTAWIGEDGSPTHQDAEYAEPACRVCYYNLEGAEISGPHHADSCDLFNSMFETVKAQRPPRAVHLPRPNAFERAMAGEEVRVVVEPAPPIVRLVHREYNEPPLGTVKPLAGAIAPVYTDELVRPEQIDNFGANLPAAPPRPVPLGTGAEMRRQWPGTPADAKIGICIGTHASVAYVHLALETLRLNNPDVSVLIHDDSSEEQDALRSLAALYGADFISTTSRRMPTVGDMSAFAEALHWGSHEGLDIVVKCSRRFIIDRPFADGLRELMHNLRYATACAPCAHFSFGFRSELTAMAVEPWIRSGALVALDELVRQNQPHGLPEALYHEIARCVHKFAHPTSSGADDDHHPACDYVVRSEQRYGRRNEQGSDSWDSYAWWPLMGLSRVSRVPGVLWHDIDGPPEYAALAQYYHLPYDEAAFTVTPGE